MTVNVVRKIIRNDFDGDEKSDILWRHGTTGKNVVWFSGDSATYAMLTQLTDLNWKVAGIGDFDGDEESDILWRHGSTGKNVIWFSGNSATYEALTQLTDANWQVQ